MDTHPQVLLTTSNLSSFPEEFRERATLLHVEAGEVTIRPPVRARAS
jgi:recombinational DNA repair ATPase RecF